MPTHYRALGHNFEADQDGYCTGLLAALRGERRGKSIDQEADCLKWLYPDGWDSEPFRRGYERGREYWERRAALGALPRQSDDQSL